MRYILLVLLLTGAMAPVHANTPPGSAIVHFDKSFYVGGEIIWYKLYLPVDFYGKDLSVQVSVARPDNTWAPDVFVPAGDRSASHGYFALPFDAPSGAYTFIFSMLLKNGETVELLRAAVPVFNDLAPLSANVRVLPAPPSAEEIAPKDLKISVRKQDNSDPNAPVRLDIRVLDDLGNPVQAECSVSVTDDVLCGPAVGQSLSIQQGQKLNTYSNWVGGIYKNGLVRHNDGRLMSSNLIPVFDIDAHQWQFAKSGEGRFYLQLPDYAGEKTFQVLGVLEEPLRVEWSHYRPQVDQKPIVYTEGILKYIDLSRKRKKIYQFYGATEAQLPAIPSLQQEDLWKGRQVFQVQQYERFPDLATFFQEVIWRVKFSKKSDRFTARMYNPEIHDDFNESPLFLIDDKATYDADYVAKLDPSLVRTIDLLFDLKQLRKYYPAVGGGGVVRIRTLSGNHPLPADKEVELLHLHGYLPPVAFPKTHPVAPSLRPLIYWTPSVGTNAQGEASISFTPAADHSTFCVEVMAQGPDGRQGSVRFYYQQ